MGSPNIATIPIVMILMIKRMMMMMMMMAAMMALLSYQFLVPLRVICMLLVTLLTITAHLRSLTEIHV